MKLCYVIVLLFVLIFLLNKCVMEFNYFVYFYYILKVLCLNFFGF